MLRISVIVPAYNDDERLQKCIDALAEQSLDCRYYEVIIVNNSTRQLTCRLPVSGFKVLQQLTPGSYAARNMGLEGAKGEIIAFTDSDCIPDRDWLKVGLDIFVKSCAERVAGRVVVFSQSDRMTAVECYEKIFAFRQESAVKKGVAVTANLFVNRKVFEKIGNFDESLLSGGDVEWNTRATNAGHGLVFSSEAFVFHPARYSWAELIKKKQRTMGGDFSRGLGYRSSVLRSFAPPVAATKRIMLSNESLRTKLLAFAVAYRIKVEKYFYFKRLLSGTASPLR